MYLTYIWDEDVFPDEHRESKSPLGKTKEGKSPSGLCLSRGTLERNVLPKVKNLNGKVTPSGTETYPLEVR